LYNSERPEIINIKVNNMKHPGDLKNDNSKNNRKL